MLSSEFFLTALIVILIPGIGTVFTISTGLVHGRGASLLAALGCTFGVVPHLIASAVGLSFVLNFGAMVFQILKVMGVIYLLFLAWQMWRDQSQIDFSRVKAKSAWQILTQGVLLNLFNPKLTLFFLAFLPQFLPKDTDDSLLHFLFLGVVFMLLTLLVFAAYGLLASAVRQFVIGKPNWIKWIQKSFALVFAVLGVHLALSRF